MAKRGHSSRDRYNIGLGLSALPELRAVWYKSSIQLIMDDVCRVAFVAPKNVKEALGYFLSLLIASQGCNEPISLLMSRKVVVLLAMVYSNRK